MAESHVLPCKCRAQLLLKTEDLIMTTGQRSLLLLLSIKSSICNGWSICRLLWAMTSCSVEYSQNAFDWMVLYVIKTCFVMHCLSYPAMKFYLHQFCVTIVFLKHFFSLPRSKVSRYFCCIAYSFFTLYLSSLLSFFCWLALIWVLKDVKS